jgi:hypothetical protein
VLLLLLLVLLAQVDGNRSIDAVFSSIAESIEAAKAKLGDPLESFCSENPSDLECKVYE